jgi:N-hydroxyarylamine O-acetyltransferase
MLMFDLDGYLGRIGYDGPRAATFDVLRVLHRLHPEAIPFENLNPLLGLPVALDPASLEAKLVRSRRGGWCFEQNTLFRLALHAMGFKTRGLAARVLWGNAAAYLGPRSHMVLEVVLGDAVLLADVGFGGVTLTGPLVMTLDVEQATPHETFRLRALGHGESRGEGGGEGGGREAGEGEYLLEALLDGWRPLYRFRRDEQLTPDYEVSSWYLCTHPDSWFRRDLAAARSFPGGRVGLRNNLLTVRRAGQASQTATLRTPREIRETLEREFHITPPEAPGLEALLARIASLPLPPEP